MATYFIHHKSLESYFIYLENPIFALMCASFHIVYFLLYIIHLINPKSSLALTNFIQLSSNQIFAVSCSWEKGIWSASSVFPSCLPVSALNFSDIEPQKVTKCKTAICLA